MREARPLVPPRTVFLRWRRLCAFPCTLVLALLIGATSCDTSSTGPAGQEEPLTELPRALSVDEREVIRASNHFAFDILRETMAEEASSDDPSENVFLSPLSASMALGMTMNGARGETLEGMSGALGFGGMGLEQINPSYRDLTRLLLGLDGGVDMRIANSIWAEEAFPFHDSFFQTARDYFDARVTSLAFGAPGAAPTMNDWVSESTGGKIESIVPDPIHPDAVMFLINAIYFKGDWRHRFDRADTRDAPFTLANGSTRPVRMMNRMGDAHVHFTPEATIVEMTYGRNAFAMTAVLPHPDSDVRALVEALDSRKWDDWTDGLREGEMMLGFPRFRLEYETTMNEPLVRLGMASAFGRLPGTDFTGMSPAGEDLYISDVVQKTFIEVNEEGTEAAAATSVEMRPTSAPPSVTFDRPFLVAIRERLSGTILFLGVIGDPGR